MSLWELGLGSPPSDPEAYYRYWNRRLGLTMLIAAGAMVAAFIVSVGLLVLAVAVSSL